MHRGDFLNSYISHSPDGVVFYRGGGGTALLEYRADDVVRKRGAVYASVRET